MGYVVTREEKYISRDNSFDGGSFKSKTYTVTNHDTPTFRSNAATAARV